MGSKPTNRLTDMQTIWFFPNLNEHVQGCLMQNFRVLASILTDIFNFLPEKGRKEGRKEGRKKKEERTKKKEERRKKKEERRKKKEERRKKKDVKEREKRCQEG